MKLRHLLLVAAVLAAPVQAPFAVPARAATTEIFLGCPTGFSLVTAPDPRRPAAASPAVVTPASRSLVVQCVAQQLSGTPSCPSGMVLQVATGPDFCRAPQRRSSSGTAIADGTSNTITANTASGTSPSISDGTSNTVSLGQSAQTSSNAPISDGTSNTISTGAGTQQLVTSPPRCSVPAVAVVDLSGQQPDGCMARITALPTEQVPVTR